MSLPITYPIEYIAQRAHIAVALRRCGVQNDLVVSGTLVEPWREFEHSDRWPVTGELHILDSTGTLFATVNTPYDQLPPPDYKEGGPEWWQSNKNRDHVKKIVCQTYPSMSEGIMISLEKFLAGLVMYPRKSESNAAQQVNIQKYNIKLEKAEEG